MKRFELLIQHTEAGELLYDVIVEAETKEQALRDYIPESPEYSVASIWEYTE